jgi:Holliday junction resolvase RusA-like endonuclease
MLRDWRRLVLSQAQQDDPERTSISGQVIVSITYYYLDRGMDIDNLAKPICDALKGFVYDDDGQIVELLVRKRYLSGSLTIPEMSIALEEALDAGEEFVHVVVNVPLYEEAAND